MATKISSNLLNLCSTYNFPKITMSISILCWFYNNMVLQYELIRLVQYCFPKDLFKTLYNLSSNIIFYHVFIIIISSFNIFTSSFHYPIMLFHLFIMESFNSSAIIFSLVQNFVDHEYLKCKGFFKNSTFYNTK